jgi:hypothetical protein
VLSGSGAGVLAVGGQLDHFEIAVEDGAEELQKASETEQRALQRGGREADAGGPLAELVAVVMRRVTRA